MEGKWRGVEETFSGLTTVTSPQAGDHEGHEENWHTNLHTHTHTHTHTHQIQMQRCVFLFYVVVSVSEILCTCRCLVVLPHDIQGRASMNYALPACSVGLQIGLAWRSNYYWNARKLKQSRFE